MLVLGSQRIVFFMLFLACKFNCGQDSKRMRWRAFESSYTVPPLLLYCCDSGAGDSVL